MEISSTSPDRSRFCGPGLFRSRAIPGWAPQRRCRARRTTRSVPLQSRDEIFLEYRGRTGGMVGHWWRDARQPCSLKGPRVAPNVVRIIASVRPSGCGAADALEVAFPRGQVRHAVNNADGARGRVGSKIPGTFFLRTVPSGRTHGSQSLRRTGSKGYRLTGQPANGAARPALAGESPGLGAPAGRYRPLQAFCSPRQLLPHSREKTRFDSAAP